MIYLLERYVGQTAAPECLIHCPIARFNRLYKKCQEKFGTFRLTKFSEYTFGADDIAFYSEEKNFDNLESRGIPPRPDVSNEEFATIKNLK